MIYICLQRYTTYIIYIIVFVSFLYVFVAPAHYLVSQKQSATQRLYESNSAFEPITYDITELNNHMLSYTVYRKTQQSHAYSL